MTVNTCSNNERKPSDLTKTNPKAKEEGREKGGEKGREEKKRRV